MYYSGAQIGSNQCYKNNCQHLCLPTYPSSFVCKCAVGFKPTDETSEVCTGVEEFLLYSVGYELKGLSVDNNTNEDVSFNVLSLIYNF